MLTSDNIATLRRAAYRSQNRQSDEPRAVVTFEGGPLDGVRLSVLQREAVSPSMASYPAMGGRCSSCTAGTGANSVACHSRAW